MEISTERTVDPKIIKQILDNEVLFKATTDDFCTVNFEDFLRLNDIDALYGDIDIDKTYFVIARVDKSIAGMVCYHPLSSAAFQGHISILPEYRKHSLDIGKVLLQWFFDMTPYFKIVAIIPTIYPNVIRFVKALNFTQEGVLTNSFLKDSRLEHQVIFCFNRPPPGSRVDEV